VNVFVDGIIFARQRHGGVSTVWREYLKRLPDCGVNIQTAAAAAVWECRPVQRCWKIDSGIG
jgi:hypothetical protein